MPRRPSRTPVALALTLTATLAAPLVGCRPTGDAPALPYPTDAGTGRVGEPVPLGDLGISSTDARAVAVKVGRRTYRLSDGAGTSWFVLPPRRYVDAERSAIEQVAARTTRPADCDAVTAELRDGARRAIGHLTPEAVDGLPVEDRHYAVTEPLLDDVEAARTDAAALGCDRLALAEALLGGLAPTVRGVLERALTPLDLTDGRARERDRTVTPTDVAQLLAPVSR